jgi:hypothetical protein
VHGCDRPDACRRLVEPAPSAPAGRLRQQVGGRLQVVLDAVIRLSRERPFEVGTRIGALAGRRFTADRARKNERNGNRRRDERQPHRRRAGGERDQCRDDRARPEADREPDPAAPARLNDGDERHRKEQQQREVRAAARDEQRDERDQAAAPEIEQHTPATRDGQSRQKITIARGVAAAAPSVAKTSTQR